MIAAILVGTFIGLWKMMKFVAKLFCILLWYVAIFIFAIFVCALSFLFNVFTVPVLLVVYIVQKRRNRQVPYVGSWLLVFYPTFTDPKVTEAKRKARRKPETKVIHYDWLTDPFFWAY